MECIVFEKYNEPVKTFEQGVLLSIANNWGPDIAWFKDRADNMLSILREQQLKRVTGDFKILVTLVYLQKGLLISYL